MAGIEEGSPISGELLSRYKYALKTLMPREYLTPEGWLRLPDGKARRTEVAVRSCLWSFISGYGRRSFYEGKEKPVLLFCVEQNKHLFVGQDYERLIAFLGANLRDVSVISLASARDLCHETVHDIQGYLYAFHPEVAARLECAVRRHARSFASLYEGLHYTVRRRYPLDVLLTMDASKCAYKSMFASRFLCKKFPMSATAIRKTAVDAKLLFSADEIPALLASACQCGDSNAAELLRAILADAGLDVSVRPGLFASHGDSLSSPSPPRNLPRSPRVI